jgi:hypothetical protein
MHGEWLRRHGGGGVLLAAVPEVLHARVADALASRFRRLAALPTDPAPCLAAVRTLLDGGATLVCGGTAAADGFRPSLFVHVRLSTALAEALAQPAPVLGLAPLEPEWAAWQSLRDRYRCLAWGVDPTIQ